MSYRKVIAFGKNSHVASLPKEWIKKNKIKKGDSLFANINGNQLVFSISKEKESEEDNVLKYNIDKLGIEEIKRLTLGAYITGYKKIIFEGSSIVKKSDKIKKLVHNLIAFEIEELNQEKIIIKDFLNLKGTSLLELFKKMDNTLRSMMSDLKKNIKNHENINIRDEDVNRLSYLIFKITKHYLKHPYLTKKFSPADLVNYYELTNRLEKIADEVKRVSRYLHQVNLNKEDRKRIIEIYSLIEKTYKQMMESVYNEDLEIANEASGKKRKILDKIDSYYRKKYKLKTIGFLLDRMKVMNSTVHNLGRFVYEK